MIADSAPRTALIAGGSGLIGRALLTLLQGGRYRTVHALVRKLPTPLPAEPKVQFQCVDFDRLPALPAADDVYIALGTTIKVAGSQEAFRRVDCEYVLAIARAARVAGARRLAVVSAMGANADSRIFYNRVKGEMQQRVAQLGYESLLIAQPSLLVGDRAALGQPVRRGEVLAGQVFAPVMRLLPRNYRPIEAKAVAATLYHAMLSAAPGVRVFKSGEMQPGSRTRAAGVHAA